MEMLKLAGFGICAALMALVVRRMRPEAGTAIALAAGTMLLILLLPTLQQAVEGIAGLANAGGLSADYLLPLMKVGGVSLLSDFSAQTCRDAGEDGLAMKVELAGRVTLIALALPFMEALLEQIMSLSP